MAPMDRSRCLASIAIEDRLTLSFGKKAYKPRSAPSMTGRKLIRFLRDQRQCGAMYQVLVDHNTNDMLKDNQICKMVFSRHEVPATAAFRNLRLNQGFQEQCGSSH